MTKYFLIILAGYLVFKIGKNAASLILEDFFKTGKLDKPEDLVQCVKCERFVSKDISIKYNKKDFCSQDCIDDYSESA